MILLTLTILTVGIVYSVSRCVCDFLSREQTIFFSRQTWIGSHPERTRAPLQVLTHTITLTHLYIYIYIYVITYIHLYKNTSHLYIYTLIILSWIGQICCWPCTCKHVLRTLYTVHVNSVGVHICLSGQFHIGWSDWLIRRSLSSSLILTKPNPPKLV